MTAYGFSGWHIEGFREGWALLPFVGGHSTPHYWRRRDLSHEYSALCGLKADQSTLHPGARVAFAEGDFATNRCRTCSKHRRGTNR